MSSQKKLEERLRVLEEKLSDKGFLANKGLGNEVGYYVFDYPAEQELIVRGWVQDKIKSGMHPIKEFNLFDMLLDLLQKEDLLEASYEMEQEEGLDNLIGAIHDLIEITEVNNYFVREIKKQVTEGTVVFITGIGEIFPFVRSHKVLNTMNLSLDAVPIVLFFPGKYDGATLRIFNKELDDNYYRAFRIQ